MTAKQSYLWYIPIVLVMILGYGLGGALVFGLHFLDWIPSLTDDTARLVLKLFGMGMLGSTMYCIKWWAKDIEEAIAKPDMLPHAFDFFGYATTVIGGAITGTVLCYIWLSDLVHCWQSQNQHQAKHAWHSHSLLHSVEAFSILKLRIGLSQPSTRC